MIDRSRNQWIPLKQSLNSLDNKHGLYWRVAPGGAATPARELQKHRGASLTEVFSRRTMFLENPVSMVTRHYWSAENVRHGCT